jgi:membrane protease YdiL (CAAX protease family)
MPVVASRREPTLFVSKEPQVGRRLLVRDRDEAPLHGPRSGDAPAGALAGGGAAAVALTYAAGGAAAAGIAAALGYEPFERSSWLGAGPAAGFVLSLGLGVLLAAVTVEGTRVLVRRALWARALHAELRPAVRGASDLALLAVAVSSAAGEEILFRGLLVPMTGIVTSSLVFGALHQIRGPARWGWMAWATLMGLLFAGLYAATGSLAGPVLAHAAINHANLRFLRDNDLSPPRRALGGLLSR